MIASGACIVPNGYYHVVLNESGIYDVERVLAHEFVHLAYCCSHVPLWLEEGLADLIPDVLLDRSSFRVDRELIARHRTFWSSETIQSFWSGLAFGNPDSSELAYSLAEIVVRQMAQEFGDRFLQFVGSASERDAGDSAARAVLGVSTARLVARFLGDGDWGMREEFRPDR